MSISSQQIKILRDVYLTRYGVLSQVFIGRGRIPTSTLYDNVEACPH